MVIIFLVYLQSMSKAFPLVAMVEMNWSIMPHGTEAKLCSAFWHKVAFSLGSVNSNQTIK